MAWHQTELYTLFHFGPNTFTGNEWGKGTEDPSLFNPSRLDARQWARAVKAGGFKGIVLVAKHHDGFCMWPSRWSEHTVAKSPFRGGKGDVIREAAEACRAEGLKFGVYLSPWDRNHPAYGQSAKYNEYYRRQQLELLTGYGPLFMFWFDGANGEGPTGKKQVYDWPMFWETVRTHQPMASMFSDIGPDVRWVGNESGFADETNWATYEIGSMMPGNSEAPRLNPTGMEGGTSWIPAEADVPLRPGWFWRKSEDAKVKSLDWLIDTYFKSVGRGASLNLGLAPNADGLLPEPDVKRLADFGRWLKTSFASDLLKGAQAQGSFGVAPGGQLVGAKDAGTWTLTLQLAKPAPASCLDLREHIQLGQRVRSHRVSVSADGASWTQASGTTIGPRRLHRFAEQMVSQVRIEISDSRAQPVLEMPKMFKLAAP